MAESSAAGRGRRGIWQGLLLMLVPIGLYATLFLARPPARAGFIFAHRFTWALAVASCALLLCLLLNAPWARSAALALLLTLHALPLLAVWTSGRSDGTVIAGLLPFSAASVVSKN